jgi:hypothetical protein
MRKTLLLCVFILLVGGLYPQEQTSDLETLILLYDPEIPRFYDITLLKRINMGIPGGDNWLVELSGKRASSDILIYVYVINENVVTMDFDVTLNFDVSKRSDFDIMRDIPGTQIGTGSCVVNDYNGDGFDDIFNYGFYGNYYRIAIIWYDPETEQMARTEIPFDIIDRRNGPAPVEFITYKGKFGFKVYFVIPSVWPDEPNPRNDKWFFYTWDAERREFVEIEEVDPRYIGADSGPLKQSVPPPVATVEGMPVEAAIVAAEQQEETVLAVAANSVKSSNFVIIIAIIAGLAVAAGVAVFLAVWRKKR